MLYYFRQGTTLIVEEGAVLKFKEGRGLFVTGQPVHYVTKSNGSLMSRVLLYKFCKNLGDIHRHVLQCIIVGGL